MKKFIFASLLSLGVSQSFGEFIESDECLRNVAQSIKEIKLQEMLIEDKEFGLELRVQLKSTLFWVRKSLATCSEEGPFYKNLQLYRDDNVYLLSAVN